MRGVGTWITIVLLSVTLAFQPLAAYIVACVERRDSFDCADWVAGAHLLFWTSHGVEDFCVASLSENDLTNGFTRAPGYDWGFDLFAIRELPGCRMSYRLDWVHIGFEDSFGKLESDNSINNDFFSDYPCHATIAFDRVNLRNYRGFNSYEYGKIDGFFGLSYLRLKQSRANGIVFDTQLTKYNESSTVNAGFVEMGMRGKVDCCPFYFLAEAGLLTGIGSRDFHLNGTTLNIAPVSAGSYREHVEDFVEVEKGRVGDKQIQLSKGCKNGNGCRTDCFVGMEYRFELGFARKYWCIDWKISAGYEGVFFPDLYLYFRPRPDGHFDRATSHLGFAGPFIGITASLPF